MTANKIIGLIGASVSHSISPCIQNAAFLALSLESFIYVPMPVSKYPYIRIKEAILGLRALGFLGANITVPYKEAVVPYLDSLADNAKAIGAVNTILIDSQNRLVGYNTDGHGFINDLAAKSIDVQNLSVLILGAGGSSRAIIHEILANGCKNIIILNRTKTKADDVANYFLNKFPSASISAYQFNKDTIKQIPYADLVINATNIGMPDSIDQMPWDDNVHFSKGQIVYDLIYNPKKTKLLQHADLDGAVTINGLGMLVEQGALSFKIWTGHDAPIDVMKKAALDAMNKI